MESKVRVSSRRSYRAIARCILVMSILFLCASCSTVSTKQRSSDVTEEGIESAQELEAMAGLLELPFVVVEGIASSTGSLLEAAAHQEKKGLTTDAAGNYLKAAVEARELLLQQEEQAHSEAEKTVLTLHNSSLARFAELWSTDPRRKEPAPYYVTSDGDRYQIVLDESSDFNPGFFDEAISADSVRGKGVVEKRREGYGAPLVAIRHKTPEREEEMRFFHPRGLHLSITLAVTDVRKEVAEGETTTVVTLAVLDPLEQDFESVGSRRFPLAADYSAPVLLMLEGKNEIALGLFGFLNAKKRAEQSGIYITEPYDPERIPVVLTHGLISAPIIWRNVLPELMSEPDIARKYQVMAFMYPSSYAIAESGMLMRDELAALRERYDPDGNDPLSNNMVAMGHSMGGVLTHMLVTDFEDRIWHEVSDIPFDEFPFEEGKIEEYRPLAFFDYDPGVRRAVFIATPHRGANMATSNLAGAASNLAKLPGNVLISTGDMFGGAPPEGVKVDIKRRVTSVQSLRPDSPILLAMDKSPYKSGVVYHSIIGDRGKGNTPDSSDGVVDYWSSHQEGAASELIVPTGHNAYKAPEAIDEMKRILRLHAGL